MIAGILVRGDDFGGIGLDIGEVAAELEKRADLIHDLGLDATGRVFGGGDHTTDTRVSFMVYKRGGQSITFEEWLDFSEIYRQAYATFDGHILLCDMTHQTSDMMKEGVKGIHLHLYDL